LNDDDLDPPAPTPSVCSISRGDGPIWPRRPWRVAVLGLIRLVGHAS